MTICNICNAEVNSIFKHLLKDHEFSVPEIYSYFNYSFETMEAHCPICGKKFIITKRQLKEFKKNSNKAIGCSSRCSILMARAISGSPFSRKEVREKAKQTMLERYGVEHSLQSTEVRDKAKKTNLERYGVENPLQSKEILDKVAKTNLEKYGGVRPASSPNVQEKMKKTMMERYGVEHAAQSTEFLEKMKKSSMEKYGVENVSQVEEIREKRKKTMLDRYGVEYPSQISGVSDIVVEKFKKTNLEKYGVEYPVQSSEVQERMKKTNLERYGVEYSIVSEQAKENARKTNLERYGVENVFKSPYFRNKAEETNLEKYGVRHASQSPEILERIKESNMEKYGIEFFCQHEKCLQAGHTRISKVNRKFSNLLQENNIENELEFIVENLGYDLKVGETLIEIDPSFTHNSTIGPCFGSNGKDPIPHNYHLLKTTFAKEHGFSCIHIFDWDDRSKMIEFLKPRVTVYARKCIIKEIDKKVAREFLESYHLQGSTKEAMHSYGLFYENNLVQVMTFGKPRYNKNYEYELLRLCTVPEVSIVGGASKILSYFEEQVSPSSIISYCDLSKFSGEVYEKIGFDLINVTEPTRHWYNPKTKRHITDNLLRQRGFDQLHKTNYGKGTSNNDLMLEHGYVEIYDCGQAVYTKNY